VLTQVVGVGALVRMLRTQAGLTQRVLATLAGLSEPTIRNIESGRILPSPETLERLMILPGFATFSELALLHGIGPETLATIKAIEHRQRMQRIGRLGGEARSTFARLAERERTLLVAVGAGLVYVHNPVDGQYLYGPCVEGLPLGQTAKQSLRPLQRLHDLGLVRRSKVKDQPSWIDPSYVMLTLSEKGRRACPT